MFESLPLFPKKENNKKEKWNHNQKIRFIKKNYERYKSLEKKTSRIQIDNVIQKENIALQIAVL